MRTFSIMHCNFHTVRLILNRRLCSKVVSGGKEWTDTPTSGNAARGRQGEILGSVSDPQSNATASVTPSPSPRQTQTQSAVFPDADDGAARGFPYGSYGVESDRMMSYKQRWSEKLKEVEQRNPVRLRRPPEIFADSFNSKHHPHPTKGTHHKTASSPHGRPRGRCVATGSLIEQLDTERIHSLRSAHGRGEQFGDFSKESQSIMRQLIGAREGSDKGADDNFLRLTNKDRPSFYFYEVKIDKLIKQRRVAEAHELFTKMISVDRVRPTTFMYACLISGYAKVGDLKQVMKLFNDLKKMGLEPNPEIYTSLFQACSKGPDKVKALESANNILGLIRHQSYQMNHFNYKAAIKCFGVCGDLEKAFALADECPREHRHDSDMFSALLMACCSDKKSGFQVAIALWRSMRKRKRLTLCSVHYNLLLRCLVYCGAGSMSSLRQLIQENVTDSASRLHGDGLDTAPPLLSGVESSPPVADGAMTESEEALSEQPAADTPEGGDREHDLNEPMFADQSALVSIEEPSDEDSSPSSELEYVTVVRRPEFEEAGTPSAERVYDGITDVLNPRLKLSRDIYVRSANTPTSRLLLLGGVNALLRRMDVHGCQPNIQTFYYLLQALPYNRQAEDRLMDMMKERAVEISMEFYTHVLLRRAIRSQYYQMDAIVAEIAERNLRPTGRLFSVLAMGCTTPEKCLRLLDDMKKHGVPPTLLTFKSMLLHAKSSNFDYQKLILDCLVEYGIEADDEFNRILQGKLNYIKRQLVLQEKGLKIRKNAIDSESLRLYEQHLRRFQASADV